MRQVERDRDPWDAIGRKPFFAEPAVRFEVESTGCQFFVKLSDSSFQWRVPDR